jgi:hypothetical protein
MDANERRRSPRVEMVRRLTGQVAAVNVPLLVREISLGGMSLQTAAPLEVGSAHEFRLTLGDESTVVLRGRVLRSTNVASADETPVYVSGVEFLEDGEDPISGLIQRFS